MKTEDGASLLVQFASSDATYGDSWIANSKNALESAVEQLRQTGASASVTSVPRPPTADERGFLIDDFLIAVLSNAVGTLVANLVVATFQQPNRPARVRVRAIESAGESAGDARSMPGAARTDATDLLLGARESEQTIRSRLEQWMRRHFHAGRTLRVEME